jgi:hypothetical protein
MWPGKMGCCLPKVGEVTPKLLKFCAHKLVSLYFLILEVSNYVQTTFEKPDHMMYYSSECWEAHTIKASDELGASRRHY